MASIAAKLNRIKKMGAHDHQSHQQNQNLSPLVAEKEAIRSAIEHSESYCMSILKQKSAFASLTGHQLKLLSQHIEQMIKQKGDILIKEGTDGNECFVIETGTAVATQTQPDGTVKEIEKLGKDSVVGEMCFVMEEKRQKTVTITSEVSKVFILTRKIYNDIVKSTSKTIARDRETLAKDVIEKVRIFQKLSVMDRHKLIQSMTAVTFPDGYYVCKQGKLGKGFFVITEGSCMVTLNNKGGGEREIRLLEVGDYFGEIALLANSNKSTANVIARDSCACMSLSKADFHLLLSSIEADIKRSNELKGMKHEEDFAAAHAASKDNLALHNHLYYRRRITGVDIHNARSETRIDSMLRRMAKFMVESIWGSMYSKYYRHMYLQYATDKEKILKYGNYAVEIMESSFSAPRIEGVVKVQNKCKEILQMLLGDRAVPVNRLNPEEGDDHAMFLAGLLEVRNQFREKLCEHWVPLQFDQVVRKFKLVKYKALSKIFGFQDELRHIHLILRGSVRLFSQQRFRGVFQEDLTAGEIFGEGGIEDTSAKGLFAQAITDVEVAVVSVDDYQWINNSTTGMHMAQLDETARFEFLSKIPILHELEPNRLLKIARAMNQVHFQRDKQVVKMGEMMSDIHFILSGTVNIVTSLAECHDHTAVVTVLHRKDYFGMSGALTSLCNLNPPITEYLDAVTATSCEMLVLPANMTFLLDDSHHCLRRLKAFFETKREWRMERFQTLQNNRKKLVRVLAAPVAKQVALSTEDVLVHQGIKLKSHDQSLESIQDPSPRENKTSLASGRDAKVQAYSIINSTPTQRSMALHTKLNDPKVRLVHDEKDFVRHLSENEQNELHSNKRVPSKIASSLPPVVAPTSRQGHRNTTIGVNGASGTRSVGRIPNADSGGNHSHRRVTHNYVADHRRGSR